MDDPLPKLRPGEPVEAVTLDPLPEWLLQSVDLAQRRLGAEVLFATDEFFGKKERLLDPAAPIFVPGKYDEHGKWMDGWETRRLRGPGHDHCVIRLGLPGRLRGVDLDTAFFDGNQPLQASLEGALVESDAGRLLPDESAWREILPRTDLGPNRRHLLAIADDRVCSHLRLHIYPDGGVARLRAFGEVATELAAVIAAAPIDLVAIENGGRALAWSDQHFGTANHLLLPGRGLDMGDGWETRRRRGPGHDWVVLALGFPGTIETIEIDTAHFKGNYPDRVAIDATLLEGRWSRQALKSCAWQTLLPEQKLRPDAVHRFEELSALGTISHARVQIYPDGGISRVRLFGTPRAR